MEHTLNGFKQFVEEMDPSPEKSRELGMNGSANQTSDKQDYFGALADELGIHPKDLVTAMSSEPWVSAHFGLGSNNAETMYKLAAWEIVPGTMTRGEDGQISGADIQLKPQSDTRSYLQGNKANNSKFQDKKRYHLSREELMKFLTTGWTPAAQAASGGMPGGMM